MGNGMMCITTPETGVMQGDANTVIKGAAPPPPPTGAVGGGGALHLSAVVVMQNALASTGAGLVPMPRLERGPAVAGEPVAFSLPKKSGENDG